MEDPLTLTLLPLLANQSTTLGQFGQAIVTVVFRYSSMPEGKRALAAYKSAMLGDRDPDDRFPEGNHAVYTELHPSNALTMYAQFVFILLRFSAAMAAEVVEVLQVATQPYGGHISLGSIDALVRTIIKADGIIGFPNLWGALAREPMVSAATRGAHAVGDLRRKQGHAAALRLAHEGVA